MAGIQEPDVWQAADALLLEGARPTIDRIREKLGRGSPNTVSRHLETWFKHLGARIKDPGAFSAPPEVADPVLQAAKHFWEVAQAESRRELDQRIQEGLAAAVLNVEAAKERASLAEAAAFDASAKLTRSQAETVELRAEIDQLRLALAASEARLQEARSLNEDLRERLQQAEASVAAVRDAARKDVATAQERAAALERRAMLEMDAERSARAKSDKRVEALELRLQAVAAEAQANQAQQLEQLATARAENGRLSTALRSAEASVEAHRTQVVDLSRELEGLRSEARAATAQADLADRVIAAFQANTAKAAATKRATKRAVRT
jgi:chromosome segregation ATPase